MTDRSLFPEGVEVHQQDLQFQADQTSFHIRQRWIDGGAPGVVSGLKVTVNASNSTLVDLAAGNGYAQDMEYSQLVATSVGLQLSTYTLGQDNYVCLIYTETSTNPEAHTTDGTPRFTRAQRSVRVKIFTLAEIQALPLTAPLLSTGQPDLSVDSQDRITVCAIVNAQGQGVPLTANNITNAPSSLRILNIQQPTQVTGIVITAIDSTTPTTQDVINATSPSNPNRLGTLSTIMGATPPSTTTATWRAPGDTTAGTAVAIAADGTYTLTSNNGHTITILVVASMLPSAPSTTFVDNLTVSDVYPTNRVQNFSADDVQHRHLLGTGIPTTRNPHGLTIADLLQAIIIAPQGIELGTALLDSSLHAVVPRIVIPASGFPSGTAERTLAVDVIMAAPNLGIHFRVYVDSGFQSFEFVNNAKWDPVAQLWSKDVPGVTSAIFTWYQAGFVTQTRQAGSVGTWADGGWDNVPIFHSGQATSQGQTTFAGNVLFGTNMLTVATDLLFPKVQINYSFGGSARTLLFQSSPSAGLTRTFRIYRAPNVAGSFGDANTFEITSNARWTTPGNNWDRDSVDESWLISSGPVSLFGIQFHSGASAAPWSDTSGGGGWDQPFGTAAILDIDTSGNLIAGGSLFSNGSTGVFIQHPSGQFQFSGPRTYFHAVPGNQANIDSTTGGLIIVSDTFGDPVSVPASLQRSVLGSAFGVTWPLHIPQGAIITNALLHGNFLNSVGGQLRAAIVRVSRAAGNPQTMNGGGGAGTYDLVADGNDVDRPLSTTAAVGVRTIDNSSFDYYIWLGNNPGGTKNEDITIWFVGCTYTLQQVSSG